MRAPRVSILIGGVLAACLAAGLGAWRYERAGRTFYTDGGAIREGAGSAPVREVLWTPPEGPAFNSGVDEYEPGLSSDGQTLYFVRGHAGGSADLYLSRRSGAGWSEPEGIEGLNTTDDELSPCPSADGRSLYFASNRPGGAGGYDLWVSHLGAGGWGGAENLSALNTADQEYTPAISPDGRMIWFSSNRPRAGEDAGDAPAAWGATIRENIAGHDFDLYWAALEKSGPGETAPVGGLNTGANEGTPAFSPAGDFAYFSSDRGGGLGGFDLYRARLADGVPVGVEGLGAPINSDANDLDPTLGMGGFSLAFSSDRAAPGRIAESAGGRRDYDILTSVSREVYRVTDAPSAARWSAMWGLVAPWLLWFVISLLTVLLILLLWRAQRNRRLSLLTRCVLGSVMVHLILLFLLSLWGVTTSLGQLFQKPGGTKVRLASSGAGDALATQVRGAGAGMPAPITMTPPPEARVALAPPIDDLAPARAERSAPAVESLGPAPPWAGAPAPTAPPTTRADLAAAPREAELAVPVPGEAMAGPEAAAAIDFDRPPTADPRPIATAPSGAGAPAPMRTMPALGSSLAHADSEGSVAAEPRPVPGRRAASDLIASLLSDEVEVPRESTPAAWEETSLSTATDPGATPEPSGMSLGVWPPPAEAEGPGAERSTPRTGGTLARTGEPGLASPDAEPAVAARLAPGGDALDLALPAEEATVRAEAVSRGEEVIAPAESPAGSVSPGIALADSDSPSEPQTAERSAVAPGASLARRAEPEGAAAASAPGASLALSPALAPADSAGADLALPSDSWAARVASAPEEQGAAAGMSIARSTIDPALPIAAGTRSDAPAPGRSDAGAGASLAMVNPAPGRESRPAASLPDASAGTLAPLGSAATDLALPQEVAPPEDQFAQRDPEARLGLVERLGGSHETEDAVARSLAWLASHQSEDGRWSSGHFDDGCRQCRGTTRIDSDIAVTGLALLCFLAADHTHVKDGPYRQNVSRALVWLRDEQKADGDLRGDETMYSHGIATIALAEAYAMTRDHGLAGPVGRAVGFIAASRNSADGGWRYEPGEPGDTSVLGWQAMALTSARRAGVTVPDEAVLAADRWLDSVSARTPGLYAYQPGMPPSHSMTAEGMYVRQLLGHGRDEAIMLASVERIVQDPPRWDERPSTYAWYYATLALFQHGGPEWEAWNAEITRELLANQRTAGATAGSWDPVDRWATIGGRVYQTAICTLTLEVYYRYLPMYAVEGRGEAPGTGGGPGPTP